MTDSKFSQKKRTRHDRFLDLDGFWSAQKTKIIAYKRFSSLKMYQKGFGSQAVPGTLLGELIALPSWILDEGRWEKKGRRGNDRKGRE